MGVTLIECECTKAVNVTQRDHMKDRKGNIAMHAVSCAHTHMLNPRKVETFGVSALLSRPTHVGPWLLCCDDIDRPSPPHGPAAACMQGKRVIRLVSASAGDV